MKNNSINTRPPFFSIKLCPKKLAKSNPLGYLKDKDLFLQEDKAKRPMTSRIIQNKSKNQNSKNIHFREDKIKLSAWE